MFASILSLIPLAAASIDMQPFNAAVRENPSSFMAYYKRATAYLAQNNDAQALKDLGKVLELNPDFEPGLYYHAKTSLRMGSSADAAENLKKCDGRCVELLEQCSEFDRLRAAAHEDSSAQEWSDCVSEASEALSYAPKSLDLRRLRYSCYMALGDASRAFLDLTEIVSQDRSDSSAVAQLAKMEFFFNGNQDKAMQLLRRCINYDPEAKQCTSTSKQLRQMQKDLKAPKLNFKRLFSTIHDEIVALGLPEEDVQQSHLVLDLQRQQCELFVESEKWPEGAEVCARVRDVDPDFVPAILLQAHLEKDSRNYQEALNLLKPLLRSGNQDPRLQVLYNEILQESQPRQRSSNTNVKDLYKILGVPEDASKKEIKKAYRELSKKYHPDKYKGEELSRDEIMTKMQEINEAHEILSDDQKHAEYEQERKGGGAQGFQGHPGGFQFQGDFPGGQGFNMDQILRQFMQQQQQQQQRGQQRGQPRQRGGQRQRRPF